MVAHIPEHVTLLSYMLLIRLPHPIAWHVSLAFFSFSFFCPSGRGLASALSNDLMSIFPLQGESPLKNISSSSDNEDKGFVVTYSACST